MALSVSNVTFELREVSLKNKPQALLEASNKGTVPVLILSDGTIIDESLEIMEWALQQQTHTPEWLELKKKNPIIELNDTEFKYYLDRYKYFDRHPEQSQDVYLEKALPFLETLEEILSQTTYIGGSKPNIVDIAVMPFVRQFYMVDQEKFNALILPKLQLWLNKFLQDELFTGIMKKYSAWSDGDKPVLYRNNKS